MNGIKHINMDKIEIPFGAYDSETLGWTYTIPKGYTAKIEDGKIVVKKEELEDEKIKKSLVKFLKSLPIKHRCEYAASELENWLAWLEKQKEQKPDCVCKDAIEIVSDDKVEEIGARFMRMRETKPTNIGEFLDRLTTVEQEFLWEHIEAVKKLDRKEKQKEQKPVEPAGKLSRQDYLYQLLIDQLITYSDYEYLTGKKPAEWREEDEKMLENIRYALSYALCNSVIDEQTTEYVMTWLKSLRPQPGLSKEDFIKFGNLEYERGFKDGERSHWKPSEEQMCYLKKVYESYDFCDGERDALESLYNDLLKKLI